MKKIIISIAIIGGITLTFATGIYAGASIESIQAYINRDIKFSVDKEAWVPKDPDGKVLAPIIYDGSSYLPVRALANATGMSIDWDSATNTIVIDTKRTPSTAGIPFKDSSSYKPGTDPNTQPSPTVPPKSNDPSSTDTELSKLPTSSVPNSILNFLVKEQNPLVVYNYYDKMFWLRSDNPGHGLQENQKLVFNVANQDFKSLTVRYWPSESAGYHNYIVKDQNGNVYPIENTSQSYPYETNQPPDSESRFRTAWQGTVHFNKGPVNQVYLYYTPLSSKHNSENLLVDSYFSK
jgi:hypothetical protein